MSDDFLRTQLRQSEAALEKARGLQQAAEQQYVAALAQLRMIASSLLAPEWGALVETTPEAVAWLPGQIGAWIVEAGTRKLNRLELSAGGDLAAVLETCAQERDQLRSETLRLRQEAERLNTELTEATKRLQAQEQELRKLREEAFGLRARVAELAVQYLQHQPKPAGWALDVFSRFRP